MHMAVGGQQGHRPGALKQQNKPHKPGRHRSKGELERDTKGRVSVKVLTKKLKKDLSKLDRRHKLNQIRAQKKDAVLEEKRSLGSKDGPPHLVVVVPLHVGISTDGAVKLIRSEENALVHENEYAKETFGLAFPRFKQRFWFVTANTGRLHDLLDLVKVADTLLFLLDPHEGWDTYGDYCLSCMFAQGLPTHVLAVQGIGALPVKKRMDAKKTLSRVIEKRFPDTKLLNLDTEQEAVLLLRHIAEQKQRHIAFRDRRSYLLAQEASFTPGDESGLLGTLKVSGYVRGQTLNVNSLIHLVGQGDFQMSQIDAPPDPIPLNPRVTKVLRRKTGDVEMKDELAEGAAEMEQDIKVLMTADPTKQESLQTEVVPDPMEGEQTWPTEEELKEVESSLNKTVKVVKRVPKGTSDYQATWILDENDEEDVESSSEEDEHMDHMEELTSEGDDVDSEKELDECETMTVAESVRDEQYDDKINEEEEKDMLEKYRQQRMEEMFPDEMDTPMDTPARIRFQKYRGLKSFRTSPWDPKENLPRDYARIFQFQNFSRTRKRIFKEIELEDTEGAMMTVMHFIVRRHPGNKEPVKSKEEITVHCGCRRYRTCPLYSQHTSADKHKCERFLQSDTAVVATVYAPITFPPSSVLMFKERSNGMHDLIATGSVLKIDPDRIIVKRIVLSGHPFKILKKTAVVRYMFFNRDDVLWFKPVELRTKWGRRGHIREPLGTHGHMKCTFDGHLKSQDTVLMNLYKRVFPKWTYDPYVPDPILWVKNENVIEMNEVI
ncbi:pre-rRNA-processing protein TSR1 homolog isoform X2 [Protopterus annectens]|uniref:pre-rRNA-processing protein TSR1 homolog isoform X2 n=1 Tax=Protopterus annectens TaxID=7888 RepID=UPI001CFA8AA3|nr:pre-rRNA-processing protein TSR1 homolog isoform X2 [Protopterus annectens]